MNHSTGEYTEPSTTSMSPLALFIVVWSVAVAFDQFYGRHWATSPKDTLLTLLAVGCVVARPSVPVFVAGAAVQMAVWFVRMPDVSNHIVFAWVVDLMLMLATATALLNERETGHRFDQRVTDMFIPAARTATLVLYGFAVLHKLNADFVFNPQQSCAVTLYDRLSVEWHILPTLRDAWMRHALIVGVLVIEASIPVLLVTTRWRSAGIVVGMAFHGLLVPLNPDFTLFVIAAYTLFTSDEQRARLSALFAHLRVHRPPALATAVLLAGWLAPESYRTGISMWLALVYVVPVLVSATSALLAGSATSTADSTTGSPVRWTDMPHRVQALPIVLMVVFGLSPYLGLRTEGAFSMFSNLETEGDATNHLFMPQWHLFHYQDSLVEVMGTNRAVDDFVSGRALVYQAFVGTLREEAQRGADFGVSFRRNHGPVTTVVSVRAFVAGLPEPTYLERKWLAFRPVWADHRCVH